MVSNSNPSISLSWDGEQLPPPISLSWDGEQLQPSISQSWNGAQLPPPISLPFPKTISTSTLP